jgi:cardiolipin synthase
MREAWSLVDRIADQFDPYLLPQVTPGNRVALLQSGQEYFPALLAAIAIARRCIYLETYLFNDDEIGRAVIQALEQAAQRGVRVRVLIDGLGGGGFAACLPARLAPSGVQVRLYRPGHWWSQRRRMLRRLHRKLVLIDERVAFVGGINIIADPRHDEITGDSLGPRFDFAVRCEGPVVAAVSLVMRRLWWAVGVGAHGLNGEPAPHRLGFLRPRREGVPVTLVLRDNLRFRRRIEQHYLRAIRQARHDVIIASAYFLPGRRFRQALLRAAQRGVRVQLLMQGRMEIRLQLKIQLKAQRALYGQLLDGGIEIHEYRRSFLHAKVAVVDTSWATVGSSNIDPFSLLMAREANVVLSHRPFCGELQQAVNRAIQTDSVRISKDRMRGRSWWERVTDWFAYGFVRLAIRVLASDTYQA